jgi:hypothetical protein
MVTRYREDNLYRRSFSLNWTMCVSHQLSPNLGAASYQIANIGSVRVVKIRKLNPIAIIALFLGLALIVGAAIFHGESPESGFSVAATGASIMVAALLLQLVWPARAFVLILKTSGGDVEALTSRKRKFVFDVKQAVEEAFIALARHRSEP